MNRNPGGLHEKGCSALLFFLLLSHGLSAADKPNIIYIMLDDAGYGDVSCYGQKKLKSRDGGLRDLIKLITESPIFLSK